MIVIYLALCSFSLASTAYVALDKKSQIVPQRDNKQG